MVTIGGGYGTCGGISPKGITDQITDQNTPYCYELGTTAINEIRVLAVVQRRDTEQNNLPGAPLPDRLKQSTDR